MLDSWYLLSSQSYHVQRAIHEAPHQNLGAIFSSNYIIGTVVRSNILHGQKEKTLLSFCRQGSHSCFVMKALQGWLPGRGPTESAVP